MRVLITGGRDFGNRALVYRELDRLHEDTPGGVSLVIEGGARGADWHARCWAEANGIACATFAANWDRYGRRAGPIRNAWMLQHGRPHLVMGFPGGAGTADMVAQAERAGVPVERIP